MLRRLCFLCVFVFFLLLAAGCSKDQTASQQYQISSNAEQPTSPSSQPEPASKKFMGSELSTIFQMTVGNVGQYYGIPESHSKQTFNGRELLVLCYEKAIIHIDEETDTLCFADVKDDILPPLRGIIIGSALDTVISAFQDDHNEQMQTFGGQQLRILYGEYGPQKSYGVVVYQDGKALRAEYADGTAGRVTFLLNDDLVERIQYEKPPES